MSNYNRLRDVYDQITAAETSLDGCIAMNMITDSDATIAIHRAHDLFHMKGKGKRALRFSEDSQTRFTDNKEKATREIIIKALNEYIRYLESYRWGINKIKTLYAYLISQSLYGIISNLYIPEELKDDMDNILGKIADITEEILTETKDYFKAKDIDTLSQSVDALGRTMLVERNDRIFPILNRYAKGTDNEPVLTEEDRQFLRDQSTKFKGFLDQPELKFIKTELGLSDGGYYRQLNSVMQGLIKRLTGDEKELLTEVLI